MYVYIYICRYMCNYTYCMRHMSNLVIDVMVARSGSIWIASPFTRMRIRNAKKKSQKTRLEDT